MRRGTREWKGYASEQRDGSGGRVAIMIISPYSHQSGAGRARYTHCDSLEGRGNGTTAGELEHDE